MGGSTTKAFRLSKWTMDVQANTDVRFSTCQWYLFQPVSSFTFALIFDPLKSPRISM